MTNPLPPIRIEIHTPLRDPNTDCYTVYFIADRNDENLCSYVFSAKSPKDLERLHAVLWLVTKSKNCVNDNKLLRPSMRSLANVSEAEWQQDFIYRLGADIFISSMKAPICFLFPMVEGVHKMFPNAIDKYTLELTPTGQDTIELDNEEPLIGWPTVIDNDNLKSYYTPISVEKLTYTNKGGMEMECSFSFPSPSMSNEPIIISKNYQ